jgi:hypothetical protein
MATLLSILDQQQKVEDDEFELDFNDDIELFKVNTAP